MGKKKMKNNFEVIIAPVITEKASALAAENKYAFRVHAKAEKIEIGRAVEALFPGVKVASVNVMNYSGKLKRMGRSPKAGRRSDWKKAIVTLSEGAIEIA